MRESMLEGKLPFPGSKLMELYPEKAKDIQAFWKVIWLNFLDSNETNGIKWYSKLGGKVYNDVVRRLSHHGWVISNSLPGRKWASVEMNTNKLLEFVTVDELEAIKATHKYDRYLLECGEARASTLVRQNGETKRTGLVRTGFRDAGNTQFGYDMDKLNEYSDAVKQNLTKSMDKIRQYCPEMRASASSYDQVVVGIYDWHLKNKHEVFTTGDNINDSRGRAISQSLKKVFNPISSKDARSALIITYEEEECTK